MPAPTEVVYLIDVDNTLLDNDSVTQDLRDHLTQAFGADSQKHYWDIFERLRTELGYADYLGALQRYREAADNGIPILLLPAPHRWMKVIFPAELRRN